jgi:hypothetical protein
LEIVLERGDPGKKVPKTGKREKQREEEAAEERRNLEKAIERTRDEIELISCVIIHTVSLGCLSL